MSDELKICGPWHNLSGYSKLTRALFRAAQCAGYTVQAVEANYYEKRSQFVGGRMEVKRLYEKWNKRIPVPEIHKTEVDAALKVKVSPQAPTLFILFPEQLAGWHEFSQGPRIGWTMIESDRITNEEWRKGLYGVDLLVAPSRYVYNTFRQEVPEVPLEWCPLPVDERIFSHEPGAVEVVGKYPGYVFFSVFNTRERKQWRVMMQAFYEEFSEEESVALVVRPCGSVGDVQEMASWTRSLKRDAQRHVYVLDKWLSEETLAAHYRHADCYILPSCEGFGLPFAEAALCGTPSIALDDGGAADIVDVQTGWLIPSRRDVVYGNLPHVYDSRHKFAVPEDIHAVRRAMRLAYESKEDKGAKARVKAQDNWTPQAIAPKLRAIVEKAEKPFSKRTVMWYWPGRKIGGVYPEWGLIVGDGFGDALGVLGNCQTLLRGNEGARINILHYGFNKGIKEFLELQPCIGEVRRIEPPDKDTAREVGNEVGAYYAYPKEKWLPKLLQGTGIDPDTVAETQIHWPWGTWPVHHPVDVRLREDAETWAEQKRAELGEFILVQPYSTSSVNVAEHWPYWTPYLRWMLQATVSTHLLVFCGLNKIPGLKGPNVIDLIGETPSMQHVFALCDRAKGTITTCNGLANWAAVRGNPALIAGNHAIPRPMMYWPRFMTTEKTKLLYVDTDLETFIKETQKFLARISK